ncbi:MAG: HAMP domain-containing histidine kinase, partial [Anaerolineae bacterium]|nr:HAMP domain-containing histidine kinase [Anaerolineae bacterium]
VAGILLVSPYANTHWSSAEQLLLLDQLDLIVPLIATGTANTAGGELEKARAEIESLKVLQAQLQSQYDQSMEIMATSTTIDNEAVTDLASLLLVQEELHHALAALRSENGRLQTLLAEQPDGDIKLNYAHMEHELQQSLAENASLKNMLASANMKIMTLELQVGQATDLDALSEFLPGLVSTVQELRQPMTSLRGHTELLLNNAAEELQPLQRKYLERIHAAVENLHHQLELIIRLASLQKNRITVNPTFFSITDLVDEAIDATRAQLSEREIALEVKLSPQLPALKLDREAILQVLVQLIQNAGGATPPQGEIKLEIKQGTLLDEAVITIEVSDQGKTVPERLRERVFLGRYRADEALVEGLGDRGLGLFIVRSLVEAHGGTVGYAVGEAGNVITVLLPLEAVLAEDGESE